MEEREIAVNFLLPDIIARMEEKQKEDKEMQSILSEVAHNAYVADNDRWEHEKDAITAEAASTARILFARNMKKMKKPPAL